MDNTSLSLPDMTRLSASADLPFSLSRFLHGALAPLLATHNVPHRAIEMAVGQAPRYRGYVQRRLRHVWVPCDGAFERGLEA